MRALYRIAFLSSLILLWHLVASAGLWPESHFPGPRAVFASAFEGISSGAYSEALLASIQRLLLGYVVSVAMGVCLGFALARWNIVNDTLGGLVLGLQALPSVCWLPPAALWFGLNDSAIIFVVVMGSLFSMTLATRSAILGVSPVLIRAARTMGAARAKLFFFVTFPAALPDIVAGTKQAWSFAWRGLLAAELLFATPGLGQLLNLGRSQNDMAQMMSIMLVIVVLGFLSDQILFTYFERRIAKVRGLVEQQ